MSVLERLEVASRAPLEGPDPKVIEFLRILEEYRIKCEDEGNYLEAGRAHKQLGILRKQEEKRQQKAVRARHISERQDVQLAHNMQFSEFNSAWDKYMEEYDNMAQMYIQQMTERHAVVLLEFQKQLRQELSSKPPKWSRELLEQRRKQHINARNKMYVEAQKLKKVCDKVEEKERREMEQSTAVIFARREAKFRQHQQTELQALLKRIECRRKEHIKQRSLDSKRLLQRNRNVQSVLESKQTVESQRLFENIKKSLLQTSLQQAGAASAGVGGVRTSSPAVSSKQRSSMGNQKTRDSSGAGQGRSGSGPGGDWSRGYSDEGKGNDYGYSQGGQPDYGDDGDIPFDTPFNAPFLDASGPRFASLEEDGDEGYDDR